MVVVTNSTQTTPKPNRGLNNSNSSLVMFDIPAEPQFRFISDTPHVEGDVLELEFELLGCASVMCDDALQPFSEDCKSGCMTTL